LADAAGHTLAGAAAKLGGEGTNATPGLAHPIASTGPGHAAGDFGDAATAGDATKKGGAGSDKLNADVPSRALARPFVPPETGVMIPLERMGVKLDSDGRVERIASSLPEIKQHTKLDVDQPGFATVAARAISLVVDSNGNLLKHDADVDLKTQ